MSTIKTHLLMGGGMSVETVKAVTAADAEVIPAEVRDALATLVMWGIDSIARRLSEQRQ